MPLLSFLEPFLQERATSSNLRPWMSPEADGSESSPSVDESAVSPAISFTLQPVPPAVEKTGLAVDGPSTSEAVGMQRCVNLGDSEPDSLQPLRSPETPLPWRSMHSPSPHGPWTPPQNLATPGPSRRQQMPRRHSPLKVLYGKNKPSRAKQERLDLAEFQS